MKALVSGQVSVGSGEGVTDGRSEAHVRAQVP